MPVGITEGVFDCRHSTSSVPPRDCERLFFPIHPKVPLIQDPTQFLLVTSPVTNIAASFLLLDDVN